MAILKYTFWNTIFLIFKSYVILLSIMIGPMAWFNFENYWVIFLSIGSLINVLPGVYLHLEYLNANKELEYCIENDQITIISINCYRRYMVSEEV